LEGWLHQRRDFQNSSLRVQSHPFFISQKSGINDENCRGRITMTGGDTWEDISSALPNIPVNALIADRLSPSVLYVGTDVGVYRSTDEGKNWHRFNTGCHR
jgi:photosystem II stability/assembly factor-like uncharacterized protein